MAKSFRKFFVSLSILSNFATLAFAQVWVESVCPPGTWAPNSSTPPTYYYTEAYQPTYYYHYTPTVVRSNTYATPTTTVESGVKARIRLLDIPEDYMLYVAGENLTKHSMNQGRVSKEIYSPPLTGTSTYYYRLYLVGLEQNGKVDKREYVVSFKKGEMKDVYFKDFQLGSEIPKIVPAPSVTLERSDLNSKPRVPVVQEIRSSEPSTPVASTAAKTVKDPKSSPIVIEVEAGQKVDVDLAKAVNGKGEFAVLATPTWLKITRDGMLFAEPSAEDVGTHYFSGSVTVTSPNRDDIGIFKFVVRVKAKP